MSQTARNYYKSEYVNGNTVRQAKPVRNPRVQTSETQKLNRATQVRANDKALSMNAPYVLFLAAVSLVCLCVCVVYLSIQSQITNTKENVASLKSQISVLQSQNDALQYSINSSVDSSQVYKTATKKLGMKQAADDQISVYKPSDSGYTVQYGDIPSK